MLFMLGANYFVFFHDRWDVRCERREMARDGTDVVMNVLDATLAARNWVALLQGRVCLFVCWKRIQARINKQTLRRRDVMSRRMVGWCANGREKYVMEMRLEGDIFQQGPGLTQIKKGMCGSNGQGITYKKESIPSNLSCPLNQIKNTLRQVKQQLVNRPLALITDTLVTNTLSPDFPSCFCCLVDSR